MIPPPPLTRILARLGCVLLALVAGSSFAQGDAAQKAVPGEGVVTFPRAMNLALHGPAVQIAERQLQAAQRTLANTEQRLTATATGGVGASWGTGETTPGLEVDVEPIALQATLNILPYGPHAEQVQRARLAEQRAQANLVDVRAEAVIEAAEQYLRALRANDEIAAAVQAVDVQQHRVNAERERVAAGAATPAAVDRAELDVARAELMLERARQDARHALTRLSILLDHAVTTITEPTTLLAVSTLASTQGIEARLDVLDAQTAVQEARLALAASSREAVPSATLDLALEHDNQDASLALEAGFDTRTLQPTVGISLDPDTNTNATGGEGRASSISVDVGFTIPLTRFAAPNSEAERLQLEQANLRLQQTRELASLDVQEHQVALARAEENEELVLVQLTQQQQALSAAEVRFDAGLIPLLDLLEARLATTRASLAYQQARHDRLLAQLRCLHATGRTPWGND